MHNALHPGIWLRVKWALSLVAIALLSGCGGGSGESTTSASSSSSAALCQPAGGNTHGWSAAVKLTNTPYDLTYIGGAADSNGNTLLLWRQLPTVTATTNQLYAARYDASCNAWRQAVRLDRTNVFQATRPVMDAGGNAVVAWAESGSTGVYASRYVASSDSWGEPVTLRPSGSGFVSITSASTKNGDLFLSWREEVAPGLFVYYDNVTRYNASTGTWGTPVRLHTDGVVGTINLYADAAGNAFAVWTQQGRVQVRRYSASAGDWEATSDLGAISVFGSLTIDNQGNAYFGLTNVRVARYDMRTAIWTTTQLDATVGANFTKVISPVTMDANGNAFVPIMRQSGDLYVARYDIAAGAWSAPSSLEITSGGTTSLALGPAVDANGNAFMFSIRSAGSGFDLNASRYGVGSNSWITTRLSSAVSGFSSTPVYSLKNGNVFVGWGQSDGSYARTYAARFDIASGSWSSASAVDATTGGHARLFHVAQDNSGNGILIGTQFNGTYNDLFGSRLDALATSWTPPMVLDTASDASITGSSMVTDSTGAVYQYWTQPNPDLTKGLYASRYDPTTKAWSQAVNLAPKLGSIHDYFQVFPDSSSLIVWRDDTVANGNLFVSVYR